MLYYTMTEYINILLIDSSVPDYNTVVDSCNANTFPIVYSYNSTRDEIKNKIETIVKNDTINKTIQRIGIFADEKARLYLENEPFFLDDENILMLSENPSFMISLINEYDVSYIDYFACNTLKHPNWVDYYDILMSLTNATVGASNNETGNIQYGGDWIMESTCQDIEQIYFSNNIKYYKYLLANTGFKVGSGSSAPDITDLFLSGSSGGTPLISSTGFIYPTDNDIISTLRVVNSILSVPVITNYYIKYPIDSDEYIDIGYFITPRVAAITLSGADRISGFTTNNTLTNYLASNQTSTSGTLYKFTSTGSFNVTESSINCYAILIGPGGWGTNRNGTVKSGAGGGGILAYFKITQGKTYDVTINAGTNSTASGTTVAGYVSIISNESTTKSVNLVANGGSTSGPGNGTVSGTSIILSATYTGGASQGQDLGNTLGYSGFKITETDISIPTEIFSDISSVVSPENFTQAGLALDKMPSGATKLGFGGAGANAGSTPTSTLTGAGGGGRFNIGGAWPSSATTDPEFVKTTGGEGKGYGTGGGLAVAIGGSGRNNPGGEGGPGVVFVYFNKNS